MNQSAKRYSPLQVALIGGAIATTATISVFSQAWTRSANAALQDSPKALVDQVWQLVNREYVDEKFNQQDFNADGIIGSPYTPIETFGNTKLVQDTTNNLYAQIGNNNPIAIKIGATQITTNSYSGWQTLAAETVNGVNQVLWKYNDSNHLHLWSLDNNWNWQSSTGWWGLNSSEAFTQETNFQQDFNGDGIIGSPYTTIEAFGNTKLVQDATNNLYAQIGNNNPTAIKIGGTNKALNQLRLDRNPPTVAIRSSRLQSLMSVHHDNCLGTKAPVIAVSTAYKPGSNATSTEAPVKAAEAFSRSFTKLQNFNYGSLTRSGKDKANRAESAASNMKPTLALKTTFAG